MRRLQEVLPGTFSTFRVCAYTMNEYRCTWFALSRVKYTKSVEMMADSPKFYNKDSSKSSGENLVFPGEFDGRRLHTLVQRKLKTRPGGFAPGRWQHWKPGGSNYWAETGLGGCEFNSRLHLPMQVLNHDVVPITTAIWTPLWTIFFSFPTGKILTELIVCKHIKAVNKALCYSDEMRMEIGSVAIVSEPPAEYWHLIQPVPLS